MKNSGIRLRLLLVEDDDDFREVLAERLVRAGFDVEPAFDFESALDCLGGKPFDVVVSDYRLSGDATGLHLLRHLRTAADKTPFLLMSGSLDFDQMDLIRPVGVDLISKPFPAESLVIKIMLLIQSVRIDGENVSAAGAKYVG